MNLIFRIFMALPAWLFVGLGGVAYLASMQLAGLLDDADARLVELANAEPPAIVDYRAGQNLDGEVALRVRLDFENSQKFYYEGEGWENYVEQFIFLEADSPAGQSAQFEAVVLFETEDEAAVEAWMDGITLEQTETTRLVELRGFADTSDLLDIEAADALSYFDASASDNFVYIRPFIDGRADYFNAEIATVQLYKEGLPLLTWAAIAVLLLIALIKMMIGRVYKGSDAASKGPSKLAVASASYGVANSLLGEDDGSDDDDLGELGLGVSIAKTVFGFLWKRRQNKAAPVAAGQPGVQHDAIPAPKAVTDAQRYKLPSADEMPVYTPPREEFLPAAQYDALVEAADAHAKVLAERNRQALAAQA